MDPLDQTRRAAELNRQEGIAHRLRYAEESRARLARAVDTKIQTAFVGALALFEKHLGEVWGHGIPDAHRTPEQRRLKVAWDACRTAVLDHGNRQRRSARSEVTEYEIVWLRHRARLNVQPRIP